MRDEAGDVLTLLGQLGADEQGRAWETFVDTYGPVVFQVVHHLERDPESARDCFVYVCEQLAAARFRRLRKYSAREKASFSTWLRCVVRNLCVDWRRSHSGRRRSFRVVESLTRLEKRVYRIHFVERSTVHETAALLGAEFPEITEESVARAVERIYSLLSPRQVWLLSTRSRRTEALNPAGGESDRELAQAGASAEDRLLEKERRHRLAGFLRQLSSQELRLLKLRFEEDRSLQGCADDLGLGSPQRAHRMLHAVLARLRTMLLG